MESVDIWHKNQRKNYIASIIGKKVLLRERQVCLQPERGFHFGKVCHGSFQDQGIPKTCFSAARMPNFQCYLSHLVLECLQ